MMVSLINPFYLKSKYNYFKFPILFLSSYRILDKISNKQFVSMIFFMDYSVFYGLKYKLGISFKFFFIINNLFVY